MRDHLPKALSPARKAALKAYAARNGRSWKLTLWSAWMSGQDVDEPEGAALRQIRNVCGPSVLKRLRLADFD